MTTYCLWASRSIFSFYVRPPPRAPLLRDLYSGPRTSDFGPEIPDSGPGTPDSGPGTPDSEQGIPDSGPETLDSGPGTLNSGPGTLDSGPGTLDSGPGTFDSGPGTFNSESGTLLVFGQRPMTYAFTHRGNFSFFSFFVRPPPLIPRSEYSIPVPFPFCICRNGYWYAFAELAKKRVTDRFRRGREGGV